jgi:glycosyltransferase involved in cell wall biosynthesis
VLDLVVSGMDRGILSESALPDAVRVTMGRYSDADLADRLSRTRGVVLPYREASQSGVQVVAMQLGVPTIVTAVGALPEFQPKSLPVVPPEDAASLASAMTHLLKTSTWDSYAEAARRQYDLHHSADAVSAGLEGMLRDA